MSDFRAPRLEVDATIQGQSVTGVFEFGPADSGQWTVDTRLRTGPLVDNAASQIFAIFGDIAGLDLENKGITIDRGGGSFAVTIQGEPTSGEVPLRDGTPAQWGANSDPDVFNATTATGASAGRKMQVFANFFRETSTDSITPARLQIGEYYPAGVLDDHLDVVVEEPSANLSNDKPGVAPVELVCVETISLDDPLDAGTQASG